MSFAYNLIYSVLSSIVLLNLVLIHLHKLSGIVLFDPHRRLLYVTLVHVHYTL